MRAVLIRHGETDWNREKRIQGHLDSPLTAVGIAQAGACGARLALEHPHFDAVLASDLERAQHTARILIEGRREQLLACRDLRERSYGIGEGLLYAEMDARYPTLFSRDQRMDPNFTPNGGESRAGFQDRVVAAFESIARQHQGKQLLVVTHGGVLGAIYRAINRIALDALQNLEIPNVAINVLLHDGHAWSIERWGDVSHLDTPTIDLV